LLTPPHRSFNASRASLIAFNDFLLMLGRRNGSTALGGDYLRPGGGLKPEAPFAGDTGQAFATGSVVDIHRRYVADKAARRGRTVAQTDENTPITSDWQGTVMTDHRLTNQP